MSNLVDLGGFQGSLVNWAITISAVGVATLVASGLSKLCVRPR